MARHVMHDNAPRDKRRVLVIDDSVVIQRLVISRLQVDGFDVVAAGCGQDGIRVAQQFCPDVILLDIDMPGIDGFETCRQLKSLAETKLIPIIFLTANCKTTDKVRAFDLGATDYVPKPFDPHELRARVRSAYRSKHLMDLLEKKAQIDGLTGLYNRAFFNHRLQAELARTSRYDHPLSLVMFDIDNFKVVNDTHGHSFGDIVLVEVAESLKALMRLMDVLARYGGEEFVAILPEQSLGRAARVAERLRVAIEGLTLEHNGKVIPVTASFGVASTENVDLKVPGALVESADKALYAAKHSGRNLVRVWLGDGPGSLESLRSIPTAV